MRIAHVCTDPGIPVFGTKGASVHIQEVVRELRARGHEVVVHAVRRGSHVPADLAGLPVNVYPVTAHEPAERELLQARASADIAARLVADPVDLVYERHSLFGTVLADVRAASGTRGVLEVNAPLIDEQREHRTLIHEDAAWDALRRQVAAAHATVCVSEHVRRWVVDHTDGGRVHTVPNGVSLRRITPRPEDPDRVVVTFVGTLKPWHGVEDLLLARARAQAPWELRIVGDGPQRGALEALARDLGVDVDFRGAVAPDAIMAHLGGTAIAVACYPAVPDESRHYFSPLKVYEYLAAGLPVVASSVGQIPRILDGLGTLVPPSSPDALAAALDALARDPRRRAELGRRGRRRAEERHSWSRVVDTILALAGVDDA